MDEYGRDLEAADRDGKMTIHYAVSAYMREWLGRNVDFDARDNRGNTPLYTAVKNEKWGNVKLLLSIESLDIN